MAVTIGGQPATVLYAGWVQDSIAGLYQVNAQLPSLTPTTANSSKFTTVAGANVSAIADNVQLPVKVTVNGQTSQDGVSIWVAPRLKVTAPATKTGTVGTQWDTTEQRVDDIRRDCSLPLCRHFGLAALGLIALKHTRSHHWLSGGQHERSVPHHCHGDRFLANTRDGSATFTLTIGPA